MNNYFTKKFFSHFSSRKKEWLDLHKVQPLEALNRLQISYDRKYKNKYCNNNRAESVFWLLDEKTSRHPANPTQQSPHHLSL